MAVQPQGPPQPQPQLRAGCIGASHGYAKLRDIGQGSYGKAMLVQDQEGKLYVMKTIDMSAMDKKQRRDAINEVRVLSALKHPYIVSYRESFSEKSVLAIVMDYADGGDLYQRVARTKKKGDSLNEARILRWFTEAALALKYMHDRHVLHRDLKSQNLFLTAADRLRIGDFGISKVLDSTAAFAKTAIGTPYYLSPEICQERPYSFGSDIWALGCVLFEMAALRVPFDAQNLQALVQKITRGPLPQIPAQYSPDLKQLVGDLLHRDQAQRPTSTEIIQRRIIQDEIRRMLQEEKAKAASQAGSAPASGPSSSPGSAHAMRKPSYRSSCSPARYPAAGPAAQHPEPSRPPAPSQYREHREGGGAREHREAQHPSRQGTPGRRH